MAIFTVTKWKCDRCGTIEPEEPHHPGEKFSVCASHEQEWAGGVMFKWMELCRDCNKVVGKQLAEMKNSADLAVRNTLAAQLDRG